MDMLPSVLKNISETYRYPSLLNYLGNMDITGKGAAVSYEILLGLLCDIEVEQGNYREIFNCLLERGELGAAKYLASNGLVNSEDEKRLAPANVKFKQALDDLVRQFLGAQLILEKTIGHPKLDMVLQKGRALINDRSFRNDRPGRLKSTLEPLLQELEEIIDKERESLSKEVTALLRHKDIDSDDFLSAIEGVQNFLKSPETLPQAQELIDLSRRAKAGNLSNDEIDLIYKIRLVKNRLVRPRSSFPAFADSRELLSFLSKNKPETEQNITKVLSHFKAFTPNKEGCIDTEKAALAICDFLGQPKPKKLFNSSVGSAFEIYFCAPRTKYRDKVVLLIPVQANDTTTKNLLKKFHDEQKAQKVTGNWFGICLYPDIAKSFIRDPYNNNKEMPFFDILDLLRISECDPGQREHALQQVILPRSPLDDVQPYNNGYGPTNIEMFRGRQDVIDELSHPKGGTVLFSGRMMGKSSVLSRLEHSILSNDNTHKCIYISNSQKDLLTELNSKLSSLLPKHACDTFLRQDRDLIPNLKDPKRLRQEKTERRLENLRQIVWQQFFNKDIKLTLLIDEADDFAEAEESKERSQSLSWTLRDLEFKNSNLLRIVFAGFQHIHRQVSHKNGAFANWFGVKHLAPLNRDEALTLIEEPFADFGFRFASQSGVERILEFTGRHPSLIQEACRQLLLRVSKRRSLDVLGKNEEILVEAGDVESICQDDSMRDQVRQVLSKNLSAYPRLNLMVYLVLYSYHRNQGESIVLEDFSSEKLGGVLVEWFGDRFNEFFDENSIGLLLRELLALGLLTKKGDNYEFMNRTFASLLLNDSNFVEKLNSLMSVVLDPHDGEAREFPTLTNEDLDTLKEAEGTCRNFVVVGLSGSQQEELSELLADFHYLQSRETLFLNCSVSRNLDDFYHQLIESKGGPRQKDLWDYLAKKNWEVIILNDVDGLAKSGDLGSLIKKLTRELKMRVVLIGNYGLSKFYMEELLDEDFCLVSQRRLRPQDIRKWGERIARKSKKPIHIEEQLSKEVCEITGGFYPLVDMFREHCETIKNINSIDSIDPNIKTVKGFARHITPERVENLLLRGIDKSLRQLLRDLYAFADAEDVWSFELEDMEYVYPDDFKTRSEEIYDAVEMLCMLDLIKSEKKEGREVMHLVKNGPLRKFFSNE